MIGIQDGTIDQKPVCTLIVDDCPELRFIIGRIALFITGDMEILVEGKQRGRWKGRTRTNKLVFFDDDRGRDWTGEMVHVEITWTGPWSLRGSLPDQKPLTPETEPIMLSLTA